VRLGGSNIDFPIIKTTKVSVETRLGTLSKANLPRVKGALCA